MADKAAPSTSTIEFSNYPVTGVVHHRLFLLIGRCGDRKDDFPIILARSKQHGPDGKIRVSHSAVDKGDVDVEANKDEASATQANFPDTEWEVNATYFKALLPLKVGENTIRLTYQSLSDPPAKKEDQKTIKLTYQPVEDAPKLHLAIVCAKDSPAVALQSAADGNADQKEDAEEVTSAAVDPKPHCTADPHSTEHTTQPPSEPSQPEVASPSSKDKDKEKDKEPGVHRLMSKAITRLKSIQQIRMSTSGMELPEVTQTTVPLIDTPPGAIRRLIQEKGLDPIRRRLAIQAYLWQAFYAEQMFRYGFSFRSINLYEVPEDSCKREKSKAGSQSADDATLDLGHLPEIPLLVSDRSLAEWRDPDNAQQKQGAKNPGAPYDFSLEAVKKHQDLLKLKGGDAVAVLILDAHWEPEIKLLVAHGAVGNFNSLANGDDPNIGVMGSHWIWAAPDRLNQLTSCFMDRTMNDTRYVNIDAGEGKTRALTVNIGSGAMLHEVGHALGNPHTPYGVMLRGYQDFHRAFVTRETHSLYGGPLKPITSAQWEDGGTKMTIHPVQAIRARLHPGFKKPDDPEPLHYTPDDPDKWAKAEPVWAEPQENGDVEVTCDAGIALMEFEWSGRIRSWVSWLGSTADQPNTPQQKVLVTSKFVHEQVGFDASDKDKPVVRITAVGCNLRNAALESFGKPAPPAAPPK